MFFLAEGFVRSQTYNVQTTKFSTRTTDEFSPVYYKEGIVFCSNQRDNSLVSYKNESNRVFKIFYVTKKAGARWNSPNLLSKEISSDVNDGPVTFNGTGNIMYFSRNNTVNNFLKNIADTSNRIGIYSAELVDGRWSKIKPFRYNNPFYSLGTQALTSDGKRIYFSSDMPGGCGGMDLYYCNWNNNDWDKPVNLGSMINTSKNESFPFLNKSGMLFFASDGHKGLGGKDIFYSQEINGKWITPVHLDADINSSADDFGLVTDSTFENGYFSTNRRNSDDIFSFTIIPTEFAHADSLRENNFCFTFYDERYQKLDTNPVTYQWDFGNGIKRMGTEVKHCFPGPGNYSVKLSIIDNLTRQPIVKQVEYKLELENILQAYIHSYNVGIINKSFSFDASKSTVKGSRILKYYWNFGDGFKQGEASIKRVFSKKGEYTIQMGIVTRADSSGMISKTCVQKKIKIYDTCHAWQSSGGLPEKKTQSSVNSSQGKTLGVNICLMDDLSIDQKNNIEHALTKSEILVVKFNDNEINPVSNSFLDGLADVLKKDSTMRLEMNVFAREEKKPDERIENSENWAQELEFYFKNKEINEKSFHSKGFGFSQATLKPLESKSILLDGVVEFYFMKNW